MANRPGQGRKPTPPQLRLVRGSERKLGPQIEVPTNAAVVDPPAWLSEDAKLEWLRLSPLLEASGLVTKLDVRAFAQYCELAALCERAWRNIETMRRQSPIFDGLVVRTPGGGIAQNPVIRTAMNAAEKLVKIGSEFGLSPVARVRISSLKAAGVSETDKLDAEFLAG
jgi:P27 family predicted phage terminase small subunit